MKRCPGCTQSLALDSFHKSRRSADGLQRLCKNCGNEARRNRQARARGKVRSHLAATDGRTCCRCGLSKPWTDFYRASSSSDGHQSYCKVCAEDATRRSREKHAEAVALRWAEKLATPVAQDGTKTCTKCHVTKPLLSFYAHRGTKDGRATYCSECQRAASRQWTKDNAERVRARNAAARAAAAPGKGKRDHRQWWLKLYGLTPADYAALLAAQDGVCAICLKPERVIDARTGEPRRLSVDHDHATGKVRGLLCARCNRTLGQMDEDMDSLIRAAGYLRRAAIA